MVTKDCVCLKCLKRFTGQSKEGWSIPCPKCGSAKNVVTTRHPLAKGID
jgi:DNA-directed RNA polymerase subunit RPC12/RpoP